MTDRAITGSDYVYDALIRAGVDLAVGIPGRGSIPLDSTIDDGDEIDYVIARHETAVPYIAWGHYEASGTPAATITVPGPGDTNAANGLRNAVMDRVPIVHVSTDTHPDDRGRGALHEVDPATYDHVVKTNADVRNPHSVPDAVEGAIADALTPPYGPVRIGMPFLDDPIEAGSAEITPERVEHDTDAAYERAAARLADADRPVVYVGVGARRSPEGRQGVREVVDALDAPVIGSYKGKGVFPETDPRWAGTSGHQLPAGAVEMLSRADVVLALGALFSGPTTRGWSLPMGEHLIHVTLEPDLIDVNYESDVAVVADPGRAGLALADRLEDAGAGGWDGATVARSVREEYLDVLAAQGAFDDRSPAPTTAVVRALAESLADETIVVADIAEFRTWALQLFPASRPEGFVSTDAWTSMGVGLPGAIGAKLARPDRPVVCLTGDGGLMMCIEELHTAVEYDADVTTVVFNNAQYAMIDSTPRLGSRGRFGWTSPDFETIAEGFGCGARTVETATDAADAVAAAVRTDRPELVNVVVDPAEPSSMDAWEYESTVELP